LAVGPTTRVIPPKVRRFVLARDGGCVIDGCTSTYRLEVHHIVPRSEDGTHDPDNLVTVCWWHHHVAIHGQGQRIDPTSPPKRRRLIPVRIAPRAPPD
jgi:5-methylcytosine-specific restriction endonuclease McrA